MSELSSKKLVAITKELEGVVMPRATYRAMLKESRSEAAEMTRIGDRLQSEASRLAEWVRSIREGVPYEVRQALVGVEFAVAEWTELRRGGTTRYPENRAVTTRKSGSVWDDPDVIERMGLFFLNEYRARAGVPPAGSLAELSEDGQADWRRQGAVALRVAFASKEEGDNAA